MTRKWSQKMSVEIMRKIKAIKTFSELSGDLSFFFGLKSKFWNGSYDIDELVRKETMIPSRKNVRKYNI